MWGLLPDPITLVSVAIGLIVAATIHEFAHAYVADRLGDPTPRKQGRLTLNPLAHLDPIGSLLIFLTGFGFAKPVQINPANFPEWRRGTIVVAMAGPLANVTLAFILGVPYKLGLFDFGRGIDSGFRMDTLILVIIHINAVLAIFNLIPIPPLDGSKILVGILPPSQAIAYARLQPYGVIVLIFLLITPISRILLSGPIDWLMQQAAGRTFL